MDSIVILGSGLNGMITALGFASKGVRAIVLERTDMNFGHDQRTIALTRGSKIFFEQIGIWSKIVEYTSPMQDIYVVDNKSPAMLHFDHKDVSGPLGYMVEMSDLRREIYDLVRHSSLIHLKTNVKYDVVESQKDRTILDVNGEKLVADLLIVCDGKKSKVREKYFRDSIEKSYNQSALTMIVEHQKEHESTAVEHFMTKGPFAILPLRDQHQSSIVWTEPTDLAKIYMSMPREQLLQHLRERFGEFLGEIKIISEIQSFPLSARVTKNYYHNQMVVVGDSAHTIHPLAGQGLNQGIKDMEAIVEIVSRNLYLKLGVDRNVLDEYTRRRKADNYLMYLITDNLNRLFSNNVPILNKMRKFGLATIERVPFFKRKLIEFATNVG